MPAAIEKQEQVLDALGNPVRRQILKLVTARPMQVNEIASNFEISRPAISRHLAQLQQADLVKMNSAGTKNIYRINHAGFTSVQHWAEGFWNDAETRLKLVAENTTETDA